MSGRKQHKVQMGMLEQFGLPQHSREDEIRSRAVGLYNAQVENLPLNDTSLATTGARIGAAIGSRLSEPTLSETEERKFELVTKLGQMVDTIQAEYPEEWGALGMEDKSLLYQRALAETAFDMGLSDIGAQAAQQYGELAAAKEKREAELKKLGYQTDKLSYQVISEGRKATEADDFVRMIPPGGGRARNIPKGHRQELERLAADGWTQELHPSRQTSTVFNDPGVKKSMEGMAEVDVEWYQGMIQNAEAATANAPLYEAMLDEMHDAHAGGGFKTGALAGPRHGVGRLMEFAGMPIPDWIGDPAAADRIEGIMSELAVDVANQMSRLTNMSITLVTDSLPNLAKTTTGNLLIAEMQQFMNRRSQEEAAFVERFRRQHGPTLVDEQGYHARERLNQWRRLPENDITTQRRYFERRIREEDRLGRRYSWNDVLKETGEALDEAADRGRIQRQPATPAPQGIPQEDWDFMTPEERALFGDGQ